MTFSEILEDLLPRLQERAEYSFPEFGFRKIQGGYEATTGELRGTKGEGHIYYYDNSPHCFVDNKAGTNVAITKYLEEDLGFTGQELLEELARRANYVLPPFDGDSSKYEARKRREGILEDATDFFAGELLAPEGKETLGYLKGRGYSEEEVLSMGLGHFPGPAKTLEALKAKGHSEKDVLEVLEFLKSRDDYKLVLPQRGLTGRTLALWGRILTSGDRKYLPLSGEAEKSVPFNMNSARGERRAILVEGYLDALVPTARGLRGVLAVTGASLTDRQIETLRKAKITSLVFSFDNDEAGRKGTERSVEKAIKEDFRTYVLELPEGFKDVDDYLRKHSIEDYRKLVENAINGPEWITYRKLSKYDLEADQGKDQALDELRVFEETVSDSIDREKIRKALSEGLGIAREALDEELESYHERKAKEREKKTYEEALRDARRKLDEGDLEEVRQILESGAKTGRASGVRGLIVPHRLENIRADLRSRSSGLLTGFHSLDEIVSIRPALTIVAGRPSHGKTTFLLNLMLNMVQEYEDKTFVFFSYEESKADLAIKFMTAMSGAVLNERSNTRTIEEYIRNRLTGEEEVDEAQKAYERLTEDRRIFFVDEAISVEKLAGTLSILKNEYDLGAVFVDYAQRVKVETRYGDERVRNLLVSENLREASAKLALPIICGAQFSRRATERQTGRPALEHLKEAGNYEEDANTVLGIYNLRMAKLFGEDSSTNFKQEPARTEPRETDFEIHVLKNRGGSPNAKTLLTFDAPVLQITDRNPRRTPSKTQDNLPF